MAKRKATAKASSAFTRDTRQKRFLYGDGGGDAGFGFEPVDEFGEGVEADDAGAVGDEITQGVDVVVVALAVTGVGDVLDAADVDAGVLHEEFDVCDCVGRWIEGFDGDAGFW